ncbi:gamma-glutamyl-gamma-aminobutyrate hydrolase family protein [Carnobacterium funditum]|uniref:gamma-glutamyl-gamma-aminobutyrate hydrolase family protein n=1 Tax=Carnobacterium funditum TaxID=2752 RepID=UPI000550445E|nr:gamma-glutamyl-gamma-aminobutyrate hydrolase family protein [Carnobacterium funditum]
MSKPIIGIPGNILRGVNETNGVTITYTPQGFIDGIQAAKGVPVIFPISPTEDASYYVDQIDGLLLAGGQDISPLLFGEEPHLKLEATEPARDAFEMALIKETLAQHKPILAICRGMHLLNVMYGGTLYQALSDYKELTVQHIQQTYFNTGSHTITLDTESQLGTIFGATYLVNSYHHQAIKELADSFKAVAWSKDNLVEGFESTDSEQSIIAVQWHPELMLKEDLKMQRLFTDFVKRASVAY